MIDEDKITFPCQALMDKYDSRIKFIHCFEAIIYYYTTECPILVHNNSVSIKILNLSNATSNSYRHNNIM